MYIYTKFGEDFTNKLNAERLKNGEKPIEERKAGAIVKFGNEILEGGPTAQAWVKRGFITKL